MERVGLVLLIILFVGACVTTKQMTVPHESRWGIYSLDLRTQQVGLIRAFPGRLAGVRLDSAGDRFVFSQRVGGDEDAQEEIFAMDADGSGIAQLTDNDVMDTYPVWSPDGSRVAFLSLRGDTLDVYSIGVDGSGEKLLYDSGFHDADIDWVGGKIVFTRNSQVWMMDDDGTSPVQVTHPPRSGEWGKANLPFGDYDPRLSPDGTRIVFSRLVADESVHGNYDLFQILPNGSGEVALTTDGHAQGLASWSPAGDRLVYVVAAIDDVGAYDLYLMQADGTGNQGITPSYFPPQFLCHSAVFSRDGSMLFFIGEWWE